ALGVHAEDGLEHLDDELARRVVVVQEDHLVELRPLGLRLGPGARLDAGLGDRRAHGASITRAAALLRRRPPRRLLMAGLVSASRVYPTCGANPPNRAGPSSVPSTPSLPQRRGCAGRARA